MLDLSMVILPLRAGNHRLIKVDMNIIESVDTFGIANTFDVIYYFPKDYEVWNIGDNFSQTEYIPLCKVLRDFQIDITSLKALYVGKEAADIIKKKANKSPFKYNDFVKFCLENPNLINRVELNPKRDEDYVTFDVANILHDIKYSYACDKVYVLNNDDYYKIDKGSLITVETCKLFNIASKDIIIAPDLYHAHKWLRVYYNLFIKVDYDQNRGVFFVDVVDDAGVFNLSEQSIAKEDFDTYEEALNAAIQYCCELIKHY